MQPGVQVHQDAQNRGSMLKGIPHLHAVQQTGIEGAAGVGVGVQPGVQVRKDAPPRRRSMRRDVLSRRCLGAPAAAAGNKRPCQPVAEKTFMSELFYNACCAV